MKNNKLYKRFITICPFICFFIILVTIFSFYSIKADMIYKLIKDTDGITWQYGYNADTKELDVMFFDSDNDITELTIPDKSYFISNDEDVEEVESYSFSNYESYNLGFPRELSSTITKIDLTNVEIVNGIKPLSNNEEDAVEIILNPNGSKIGKDAFRNLRITILNLDKVLEVGPGAFYKTIFTETNINLPNVTSVLDGSFEESNITSLKINSPEIGISAFKNCKYLTSVTLLDNVKTILDSAFEGDSRLAYFIFNHAKNIGNNAFKDCTSWNIDIKDTEIETLGTGVFWGDTGYRISITLPEKVKGINWRTFYETNITGLNLRNVEVIGAEAFRDCKGLSSIDFGKVDTINYRAFINDSNIHNLDLSTGVIDIQTQAFDNCGIENLNLNGVQKIEHGAFANNIIKELYLPKSIAVMNTSAIWYNNPITKITIAFDTLSNQIKMLWVLLDKDGYNYTDATYNGSKYLEMVELVAPYSSTESANINSRFNVSRNYFLNQYPTMISKDQGSDQNWANRYKNVLQANFLNNLLNLENVKIGEGYEFLGAAQFNAWYDTAHTIIPKDKLKSISLPSTLKGIGAAAFQQTFSANNVPTINLPQSLEFIGACAFLLSFGFKNDIYLPNLKEVGSYAFMYSGIVGITLNNKLEYIGREVANLTPYLKKIVLDCDFYDLVKRYDNDYDYSDKQIFAAYFPTSYSSFYQTSFKHDGQYDLIQFTSNVKTNPTFSSTSYGMNFGAFYNIKVTNFILQDSQITNLGKNTFIETSVSTLVLPNTLKSIGNDAFYNSKIDVMDFSNTSVETVGKLAFMRVNASLIKFPPSLKKIGTQLFYKSKINTIDFENTQLETIDDNAFQEVQAEKVLLSSTLKEIGKHAFFDAKVEQNVMLSSSIQKIDNNAFQFFDSVNFHIDLPNLTYLGDYAFQYSSITGVTLNDKLTYIGTNAVNQTKNLKKIIVDCDFYAIAQYSDYYAKYGQAFSNFFPHVNNGYSNNYELIIFTDKALTNPNTAGSYFSKVIATDFQLADSKFTNLGEKAFLEAEFTNLSLPKGLSIIKNNTFLRAKVKNSVEIPDSITTFEENAFMSADLYASNNLPNSLKTIGDCALLDTIYNNDIIVPAGVTSIGYSAFNGGYDKNTHLHLNLQRNSVTFLNPMNATVTKNQPIHNLFRNSILNELIFGENVTDLPTNTLNNDKSKDETKPEFAQMTIKKITLKNIKKVPSKAFLECNNLEEIDMSAAAGLNEFGYYAFIDTPALRKVKIRQGLNITAKDFAFLRSGLETLGDEYSGLDVSNNKIILDGQFIFSYMPNLKEIKLKGEKINNGVLPKGTFYQDKKLETVILDDKFTELKQQVFANDDSLKSVVMFGDTKIFDNTTTHTATFNDIEELNIYINEDTKDFTITIKDPSNGNTTITKSNFIDNKYVYKKSKKLNSITLETSDKVFLDKTASDSVSIRNISVDTITIDPRADVYCYLKNEYCKTYNQTYREAKDFYKTDLYYLDEVLYLDSNNNQINLNDNQTGVITDDLVLYALRRDGIILVSEEWGKKTGAVKYADSGITIKDYNAATTNPRLKVFNTPLPIDQVDTDTNDNFKNVTYSIGDIDPDTKRIPINFVYPNKVVETTAETDLKSYGNTASVIYSDGCGGEAFANVIFMNVLIGRQTPNYDGIPTREGYEFIGWDKEIATIVSQDVIYTAKWKKKEIEYPIPSVDPPPQQPTPTNILEIVENPFTINSLVVFMGLILSIIILTISKKLIKY